MIYSKSAEDEIRFIELLKRLIEKGNARQYKLFLHKYHEADVAEALEEVPFEYRLKFFQAVNPEIAVEVLEEMELPRQIELVSDLKANVAARFIEEMEPDDAADLMEELYDMDEELADTIIDALPKEEASYIRELLSYKEDSAGALMTSGYISIPENLTVKQALSRIKSQNPPDSEVSFYAFIINTKGQLVGYTTLRNLVMTRLDKKVRDIRNDYPISANIDLDQEEVAMLFRKYDLVVLPVVTAEDHLVGIITVDDVVDVVVEEATEDIYKLSGTSDIEESKLLSGRIRDAVISRMPWLILTVFGGMFASLIITRYSGIYHAGLFPLALSLSFLPLLMGLGGNVGNQSATIIVRGLATGFVKEDRPLQYIFRELFVGFFIGIIVGSIVGLFNFLTGVSVILSLIVSITLTANIFVASFIGASLPIFFKKLHIDPAIASAPFISSALDIIGQLIYFSLSLAVIYYVLG